MPYSGFEANWVNQKTGANDYVRKHKFVLHFFVLCYICPLYPLTSPYSPFLL